MSPSNRNSAAIVGCLLTILVAAGLATPAGAKESASSNEVVTITEGIVVVVEGGTVFVDVEGEDELLVPSNGRGLLRAGQIFDGDLVVVKIVRDKKRRHRGHVTVLK